jgi:hypothetical protein
MRVIVSSKVQSGHRARAFSKACLCYFSIIALRLILTPPSVVNARAPLPAQTQADEYRVKAAFLFHFAQLVEWPSGALGPDNRAFTFCTVGEDLVPGTLEATVEGKQIGSRSIQVRHVQESADLQACQVLFLAVRDNKRVPPILASLKTASVLTVGNAENFADEGGMIGFCLQESKIRFDINLQAAQRAHLKISSRLLVLAKRVVGDSGQG